MKNKPLAKRKSYQRDNRYKEPNGVFRIEKYSKMEGTVETICELDDKMIENIQSKQPRENRLKMYT